MNPQIVELFYRLARDYLPMGVIEEIVQAIEKNKNDDAVYTNLYLEQMALVWGARING